MGTNDILGGKREHHDACDDSTAPLKHMHRSHSFTQAELARVSPVHSYMERSREVFAPGSLWRVANVKHTFHSRPDSLGQRRHNGHAHHVSNLVVDTVRIAAGTEQEGLGQALIRGEGQ